MAVLTVQEIDITGVAVSTAAAAGGGDLVPNTGREVIRVTNGSGGEITVTITAQTASNFGETVNKTVAIANGATKYIGPFLKAKFDNASGQVAIAYTDVSSVTVAVIRVPDPLTALL